MSKTKRYEVPALQELYAKPTSAFTDEVLEIDVSLEAAIEFLKGARKKLKQSQPNAAVGAALVSVVFAMDSLDAAFKAGLRELKK